MLLVMNVVSMLLICFIHFVFNTQTPVLFEMKRSDPLYDVKCTYYRRDLSIPYRRIRICVGDNESTKLMLAMLRLMEADQEDFHHFSSFSARLLLVSCANSTFYRSIRDAQVAISLKNEYQSMQALAKICDEYLRKYPTTYEEDCYRLKHGNVELFSNERNGLIQVKGEKEVLLFYKDFAQTAIRLLKASDLEEFDELLDNIRVSKHSFIFQYCRGTIARLVQEEIRLGERRSKQPLDLSRPTLV